VLCIAVRTNLRQAKKSVCYLQTLGWDFFFYNKKQPTVPSVWESSTAGECWQRLSLVGFLPGLALNLGLVCGESAGKIYMTWSPTVWVLRKEVLHVLYLILLFQDTKNYRHVVFASAKIVIDKYWQNVWIYQRFVQSYSKETNKGPQLKVVTDLMMKSLESMSPP